MSLFVTNDSAIRALHLQMLSYLNAADLAVMHNVSRYWNELTRDKSLVEQLNLKTLFQRATVIDESCWKTYINLSQYNLSFEGSVLNNSEMIPAIRKCLSWPIESANGIKLGITVLQIPKGLSINILKIIAPQYFAQNSSEFLQNHGNTVVDKAYTLCISDNVIAGTRKKNAEEQLRRIKEYGVKPQAIEVITQIVLTCLTSEKRIYIKDYDWLTYTRCENAGVDNDYTIGGVGSIGFYVRRISSIGEAIGLAAVLKME